MYRLIQKVAHSAKTDGVINELAHMGKYSQVLIVLSLVHNSFITPQALGVLSGHSYQAIRGIVAGNSKTPKAFLNYLARNEEQLHRILSTNVATPPTALTYIYRMTFCQVIRTNIINHPNTPVSFLKSIIQNRRTNIGYRINAVDTLERRTGKRLIIKHGSSDCVLVDR